MIVVLTGRPLFFYRQNNELFSTVELLYVIGFLRFLGYPRAGVNLDIIDNPCRLDLLSHSLHQEQKTERYQSDNRNPLNHIPADFRFYYLFIYTEGQRLIR